VDNRIPQSGTPQDLIMFYVYILKSISSEKYYIGYTSNLDKRIERHNKGGSVWSKIYRPWRLVYSEEYNNRSEAIKREKEIKNFKGNVQFKSLIAC